MIYTFLIQAAQRFIEFTDRVSKGKYMPWVLPFIAVLVSLFFAFPSYDLAHAPEMSENWDALLSQVENPFKPVQYTETSHAANLSFRLTPVLLAGTLGGHTITFFLVVQLVALIMMFVLLYFLFVEVSGDRVTAVLLIFSISFVFVGNVLCSDYRGFFDVFAFLFLAATMFFRSPVIVLIASLLAYFTDERAFIASGLVFIYFILDKQPDIQALNFRTILRFNSRMIVLVLSWVIYLGLRFSLSSMYGLKTNTGGMVSYLFAETIKHVNSAPLGVWTGLEGFWIPVALAVIVMIQLRLGIFLMLYGLGILFVVFIALWVFDITRSMAYLMPAVFVAFVVLSRTNSIKALRYIAIITLIISIFPTYYLGGPNQIQVFYPLPFQLLRMML